MLIFNFTPGFIFLIGGIFTFLFKQRLIKLIPIFTPIIALISILSLVPGDTLSYPFLLTNLEFLYVDTLSLLFGYLFIGLAFLAFMYGIKMAKWSEYSAALFYIGSALSIIFTNHLITLYIFWELMAVSSVFLILISHNNRSLKSALRYIIVHLVGGLILLAGIILYYKSTGSFLLTKMNLNSIETILIFIGFLVNAAAVPFSSWLSDSYPESTLMGGVILSSITTKTAIYVLLRGFSGSDILIWIGAITAVYGVIYGLLENNIRRSLSFSVINQVGFKLVGIGLGTPLAIAGVCAHVFCGVIYNSVLWMTSGTLIKNTGKEKFTDLVGTGRNLPLTFLFSVIGALSIASFPFTGGYVSKTVILKAVELEHLFFPWLILEFASFGVILFITAKYIYYGFLYKNTNDKPKYFQAYKYPFMAISTCIASILCIVLGLFPKVLFQNLPYASVIMKKFSYTFVDIYSNYELLIIQLQKFSFAILAFVLFIKYIPVNNKQILDFDWIYRRLLRYITVILLAFIDFVYNSVNNFFMTIVTNIKYFLSQSLEIILYLVNLPSLRVSNPTINKSELFKRYNNYIIRNGFPFALLGSFVFILSILLLLLESF